MTHRAPAWSQILVIPIASSPQRTDERPTSHAESTTVCGTSGMRSMSYPNSVPSASSRPENIGLSTACRPCAAMWRTSTCDDRRVVSAIVAGARTVGSRHAAAATWTSSWPRGTRGPIANPAVVGVITVSRRSRSQREIDGASVNVRPRVAGSIAQGTPLRTPGAVTISRRAPAIRTASSSSARDSAASRSSSDRRTTFARGPAPMDAAMSRSARSPGSSRRTSGHPSRRTNRASAAVATTTPSASPEKTNARMAVSVSRAPCASAKRCPLVHGPVSRRRPLPLPCARLQLRGARVRQPVVVSSARSMRSSARSSASASSGGGRSGTTCRLRWRARSDHSKITSGRRERTAECESGADQAVAVHRHRRLQVEAAERLLPARTAHPGPAAACRRASASRPRAAARAARTSCASSSNLHRRRRRDADAAHRRRPRPGARATAGAPVAGQRGLAAEAAAVRARMRAARPTAATGGRRDVRHAVAAARPPDRR